MSDETFFREVNEEIRRQRVHDLWRRFGRWMIAGAVLAVVFAIGYVAWREYRNGATNSAGDRFISAVDLADAGKLDAAVPELDGLAKGGFGSYPQLADLRLASVRARQGDAKAALDGFDKVANDTGAPAPLRDIAAVRAAYVLVDTGSFDEVRARVERLSGDAEPLRFAAREALGLAAWKAGNLDDARRFLTQNRNDAMTPSGVALRSRLVLDLVEAGTTPATAAAEAAAAPQKAPAAAPLPDTPIPLDLVPPTADLPAPAELSPPAPPESPPPAMPDQPAPAGAPAPPAAPSN